MVARGNINERLSKKRLSSASAPEHSSRARAVRRNSCGRRRRDLWPFFPGAYAVRTRVSDLTRVPGRPGCATGQIIEISGQVLRVDGSPVKRATMEVWQANAAGRYANPLDKNPAPLDPNFEGVALLRTTDDGRYRILTVKPGAYPEVTGTMRTPHIHFDVTSDEYRLVAQMYFSGRSAQ